MPSKPLPLARLSWQEKICLPLYVPSSPPLPAGGLVIGPDVLFPSRSRQLAALSVRHAVPAVFETREFIATGGLANTPPSS